MASNCDPEFTWHTSPDLQTGVEPTRVPPAQMIGSTSVAATINTRLARIMFFRKPKWTASARLDNYTDGLASAWLFQASASNAFTRPANTRCKSLTDFANQAC